MTERPPGVDRVRTVFLGSGAFAVPSLRAPGRASIGRAGGGRHRPAEARRAQAAARALARPRGRHRSRPDAVAAARSGRRRRDPRPSPGAGRARRLRPDRPRGAPGPAVRGPQPAPVAAAPAPRRLAGPRHDPRRRPRDRRDADAHGPRDSTRARSSRSSGVPLAGSEAAPELEARLAILAAGLLDRSLDPWLRGRARRDRPGRRRRHADPAVAPRGRPARSRAGPRPSSSGASAPTCRGPGRSSRPTASGSSSGPPPSRPRHRATSRDASCATATGPRSTTADGRLVLEQVTPAGASPDARRGLPARPAASAVARLTLVGERVRIDGDGGSIAHGTRRRTRARASAASRPRPWRRGSRSAATPAYRARQVLDAAWTGRESSFSEILTLPAALRDELDEAFRFDTAVEREVREADGGLTEKVLHTLADGQLIESVLMHYPARGASRERHTLCISSQAGCAVGCPFCATGELGLRARPRDRGDRRPGPPRGPRPGRGRQAADQRRLHGHGRAAAQPRPGPRLDRRAQRPAPPRARRPPHHGVHVRGRARDPAPDRARAPVHAGRQPARRAQRAARRARAAQPALAGRGGRRGRARARRVDRTPRHLRGHDDRRDQRHGPRRRRPRRPAARRPRAREPDPDEPGRAHAVDRDADPGHRAVRRPAARGRHRDDDPGQPRDRDRRRVRAAGRRARRASPRRSSSVAAASGSSPRARPPCAASAATTRSRPGWGSATVGGR